MNPPIGIDLKCSDADGNKFVGRYDTLIGVLFDGAVKQNTDIGKRLRWFKQAKDGGWEVTKRPVAWSFGPGTSDQWIADQLGGL